MTRVMQSHDNSELLYLNYKIHGGVGQISVELRSAVSNLPIDGYTHQNFELIKCAGRATCRNKGSGSDETRRVLKWKIPDDVGEATSASLPVGRFRVHLKLTNATAYAVTTATPAP